MGISPLAHPEGLGHASELPHLLAPHTSSKAIVDTVCTSDHFLLRLKRDNADNRTCTKGGREWREGERRGGGQQREVVKWETRIGEFKQY